MRRYENAVSTSSFHKKLKNKSGFINFTSQMNFIQKFE